MRYSLRIQTGIAERPILDVELPPETYLFHRTPPIPEMKLFYGVVVVEDSRDREQAGSGLRTMLGTSTTVSGRRRNREGHLRMQVEENRATLTDLGSSNGSYLDGKQFTTAILSSIGSHALTLGSFELELIASE